jgi:glutaminyl-peptide cyclotransferase
MIRNNLKWIVMALLLIFIGTAMIPLFEKCQSEPKDPNKGTVELELPNINIPSFNADSAYRFTERIVAFGPRVTGSEGAAKVKTYVVGAFKKYGGDIIEQKFTAKTYDGKSLPATNIIARFNLQAPKRIVLSAHWDSRPFADQDTTKKDKPIVGADDAASAVGSLIEMARQLQNTPLSNVGIDIVLFDAEDYGDSSGKDGSDFTWCLGSQHWAKNLHVAGYAPRYGINLDMIGAKGARFTQELVSLKFAPQVVQKVWFVAKKAGYGNFFVDATSRGPITDDHLFVNNFAKIPMIDIINHPNDTYFGTYWHTHDDDDMDDIDRESLKATGQTVLNLLHYENAGAFGN